MAFVGLAFIGEQVLPVTLLLVDLGLRFGGQQPGLLCNNYLRKVKRYPSDYPKPLLYPLNSIPRHCSAVGTDTLTLNPKPWHPKAL